MPRKARKNILMLYPRVTRIDADEMMEPVLVIETGVKGWSVGVNPEEADLLRMKIEDFLRETNWRAASPVEESPARSEETSNGL